MKKILFNFITSLTFKNNFLFYLVLGMMFILTKPTSAQDHGFGMGIIVGEPTGLSAKFWTSKENAFDFGFGVSVGGDRIKYKGDYNRGSRIHFHMDYLWHAFNAINSAERFPLYYGIGGRFNTGGNYEGSFGVRGVFGIAWFPRSTPIDVFLELVPVFQVTPLTGLGIDAGLGVRYFFE